MKFPLFVPIVSCSIAGRCWKEPGHHWKELWSSKAKGGERIFGLKSICKKLLSQVGKYLPKDVSKFNHARDIPLTRKEVFKNLKRLVYSAVQYQSICTNHQETHDRRLDWNPKLNLTIICNLVSKPIISTGTKRQKQSKPLKI